MIREVLDLTRLRDMSPDAAAALLAARRLDGAEHDEPVLQAWLGLDGAHRRAWASVDQALAAFEGAEDDEILMALRQAARAAGPPPAWRWRGAATAAAVLLVLAGGMVVTLRFQAVPGARQSTPQISAQVAALPRAVGYLTHKGERKDVVLPDGSRMTLDTDSAVEVAFTADRRTLSLSKGRAFFNVEHDASRPFAVRVADREVVALGTRFDVRLDPGRVQVILVEGRVSVSELDGASPPQLLQAGEELVARRGLPAAVSPANVNETLDWQHGLVTFRNSRLSDAADELNRYGGDRLIVRDPRVARLRVTGVFRTGDAARFGRTLSQIYPVQVARLSAGEVEIVPAAGTR